jgi:hypothetical protein
MCEFGSSNLGGISSIWAKSSLHKADNFGHHTRSGRQPKERCAAARRLRGLHKLLAFSSVRDVVKARAVRCSYSVADDVSSLMLDEQRVG